MAGRPLSELFWHRCCSEPGNPRTCCRVCVVLGPLGHALLSPHMDSGDGGSISLTGCCRNMGKRSRAGNTVLGKVGHDPRDDAQGAQGREDPTPEGRICLHGIIPGKRKSDLHLVTSSSPRNQLGFLSPPTKLSERNHAHPLMNPNWHSSSSQITPA